MRYEMEELVPLVRELAEKYTSHESTSITYEKAEQLMEAVLYCIHEAEQPGHNSIIPGNAVSARQVYQTRLQYVNEKTKQALNLYNTILPEFAYYKNRCLFDTFAKGIPEFFKWYDIQFEPQNTILTLDYPVLRDISGHSGIDKIYEFIRCIDLEQRFLKIFPETYVLGILSNYNRQYEDMIENISEIMFMTLIGYSLAEKPLSEPVFNHSDYLKIQKKLLSDNRYEITKQIERVLALFMQEYSGDCNEAADYLMSGTKNILVRMKNAAENNSLYRLFNNQEV